MLDVRADVQRETVSVKSVAGKRFAQVTRCTTHPAAKGQEQVPRHHIGPEERSQAFCSNYRIVNVNFTNQEESKAETFIMDEDGNRQAKSRILIDRLPHAEHESQLEDELGDGQIQNDQSR